METTDTPISMSEKPPGKYELWGSDGSILAAAGSIKEAEEFAANQRDGTYLVRKVLRRVVVSTPEPQRKVTATSLESRPRKPRDPNAPKRPRRSRRPATT